MNLIGQGAADIPQHGCLFFTPTTDNGIHRRYAIIQEYIRSMPTIKRHLFTFRRGVNTRLNICIVSSQPQYQHSTSTRWMAWRLIW